MCNFLQFHLYSKAKITLYIFLCITQFANGLQGSRVGYSAFSGLFLPPPRITICNLKTADRCGESYQESWSAHTVLGQCLLWTCCDTKYAVSTVAQLYCQQRDVAHHENSMHQLPTEIDLSKSRLPPLHRPAYSATCLAERDESGSVYISVASRDTLCCRWQRTGVGILTRQKEKVITFLERNRKVHSLCFDRSIEGALYAKILSCSLSVFNVPNWKQEFRISARSLKSHPSVYRGSDKSLARSGRKQTTATGDFELHISYL
jgi:hypothetical protein